MRPKTGSGVQIASFHFDIVCAWMTLFKVKEKGNKASSKRFLKVRYNFRVPHLISFEGVIFTSNSLVTIRCSPVITASNSFNISSFFPLRLDWTIPQPFSHTHCLLARPCQHTFLLPSWSGSPLSVFPPMRNQKDCFLFCFCFFLPKSCHRMF